MVTSQDVHRFAALTGDESLLHLDSGFAQMAGFKGPPVHGMFLDSLVSSVMGTELPGSGTLYMEHTTRFIRPVYQGDTIEITVEFLSYEERDDCYVGLFRGTCKNQYGERVLTSSCSQMMMKRLFEATGPVEDGFNTTSEERNQTMTNLEKYDQLFIKDLRVKKEDLEDLKYRGISTWDSMGHMDLVTDLEEVFDIHFNTADVMNFSSYEKGKEVMKKYGVTI